MAKQKQKAQPTDDDIEAAISRLEAGADRLFRDQLRDGRAAALASAENSGPLFVAFDQLGKFLWPSGKGLGDYRPALASVAQRSTLAEGLSPEFHAVFSVLFGHVLRARNDAMHQGIFARHLTRYAVQMADILEDALMSENHTVGDFMIRSPVCAERWHPLSFVRQKMIEDSFTYLPVKDVSGEWKLVSNEALARALRVEKDGKALDAKGRGRRLKLTVAEAELEDVLELETPAAKVAATTNISKLAHAQLNGKMVLIAETIRTVDAQGNVAGPIEERLAGVLMPFDLL